MKSRFLVASSASNRNVSGSYVTTVVKLWGNAGERHSLSVLAGERRSSSLHDDSYLQHKQQKKMCVKCMI